jgi:hypothetical protein
VKAAELNSSILVGFFIRNAHDLEEIDELAKHVTTYSFAFVEQKPTEPDLADDEEWVS